MTVRLPSGGSDLTFEARQTRAEMRDGVFAEFDDWEMRLDNLDEHPDPRSPGGLPPAWALVAHREFLLEGQTQAILGLARRDTGGWLLMRHHRVSDGRSPGLHGPRRTYVGAYAGSVTDLWLLVQERNHLRPLEDPLRDVILAAYDPADPVEAAERTLVALGGPVVLTPRCLEQRFLDTR